MATIKDILKIKGADVKTAQKQTTVLQAAHAMNQAGIGALVVLLGDQVEGIITERDMLRRVIVAELDPGTTTVEQVMTREVACCLLHTPINEVKSIMKNHKIRHLPVLDGQKRMVGIISIGDLNAYETNEQETTIKHLHEYLYGSTG